jgi:exodeoxyribonuclease VII large subunit
LIDYVSDKRAPTPTAAAELAVPVRLDLLAWVGEQDARLSRAVTQDLFQKRQRLRDLSRAMPKPAVLVENASQRLDRAAERLPAALRLVTQTKRLRLTEASAALRPDAMRRITREARSRLDERAARLQPSLLTRDMKRRADDLERISARLSAVAAAQLHGWSDRLNALERMRQTLGYTETLKRGYAVVRGDAEVVTTAKAAGKAKELEIEFSDGRLPIGTTSPASKPKPAKMPPQDQGTLF